MRLDHYLFQHSLAPSRSQAQLMVREGKVRVNGEIATKTGQSVEESDKVELLEELRFVGRGSQKLLAALEAFSIDPAGKAAADVGASTGGFTQVLLEKGARKVYALDVGHGQLAESLKNDPRVLSLEGVNIRHGVSLPEKADLVVADLSFISLRLVMEPMRQLAKPGADFILLFKPQFEVGKEKVGKNGLVKNERSRQKALEDFLAWCQEEGWTLRGKTDSPIEGKTGNREVLLWLRPGASDLA